MNGLNHLKNEYKSICASDDLKQRANAILKTKRIPFYKKASASAATFLILFAAVFNLFPELAGAAAEIPVLNTVIRVITLGRYENKDMGYEAKVVTPKIEGLADKELEERLNNDLKENAKIVISAYEKDVEELKKEFGEETIHMGVTLDYCIKTDTKDILALDVYLLYTAGSSNTKHTFYTIDKNSGKLLSLKDLFKKDADYITPVSEYIKSEMKRINQEEHGLFWVDDKEIPFDTFKKIKEDQNFYINEKNELVICFDKYDVAAGAQGSPEFVIPKSVTNPLARPRSVICK